MFDVVLLMAGSGERSQLGYNKVLHPIGGKPLFMYAYETFRHLKDCHQIILVVKKEEWQHVSHLENDKTVIVTGGVTRQDSVLNGIEKATLPIVLIHDAARANIKKDDILKVYQETLQHNAAVLAVKAQDTIKEVDQMMVKKTLNRNHLWLMQTPQGVIKSQLIICLKSAKQDGYLAFDDVELLEKYAGIKAKIVEGNPSNIKVTTFTDLKIMETLMKEGL